MIDENGKMVWFKTADGIMCWTGGTVRENGVCLWCGSSGDHYEDTDKPEKMKENEQERKE